MKLSISQKSKSILFNSILFIIFVFITTRWIINIHTPVFKEFTFEISCLQSKLPCEAKINEQPKEVFRQSIKLAVRNSNRLGKLSEIYQSVMRFHLDIVNKADGYIKYPATPTSDVSRHILASIQCDKESFNYGSSKLIEKDFILSDSSEEILNKALNFIQTCSTTYATPKDLEGLPPVPPNTIVVFDFGPKFLPVLSSDYWSWLIIYIFNTIIILGVLPLLRGGYFLISKGLEYFSNPKED